MAMRIVGALAARRKMATPVAVVGSSGCHAAVGFPAPWLIDVDGDQADADRDDAGLRRDVQRGRPVGAMPVAPTVRLQMAAIEPWSRRRSIAGLASAADEDGSAASTNTRVDHRGDGASTRQANRADQLAMKLQQASPRRRHAEHDLDRGVAEGGDIRR